MKGMGGMRTLKIICALAVILAATPGLATPPPYEDEDILGLELSGELLAPAALVAQIAQDLTAIRTAFPAVADIHVFPSWLPGVIVMSLSDEAWADYEAGDFTEFNALNVEYGPVTVNPLNHNNLYLEFVALYHPLVLAPIYEQVEGILWAGSTGIGGDGSDIFTQQLGLYTFKEGWGDCPSGCMFNHFWEFSVNGGVVDLVDEYGDFVGTVGDGPPGLAAQLDQNIPNPFNPVTVIRYRTDKPGQVRLLIHDMAGRMIRELENGYVLPGNHIVEWDATDSRGLPVASGIYFYKLVADGVVHSRKMVLTK